MRFKIGGTKFGHVPFTGLSPTETQQQQARPGGRVPAPAVGRPGAGVNPPAVLGPLQQRAPARPAAVQPPGAGEDQSHESRLTRAIIRFPSSREALMRQALGEASLERPDPPGRTFHEHVSDPHSSKSVSHGVQWSKNVIIPFLGSQQGSQHVASAGQKAGSHESPGGVTNTRPYVPRSPSAQPPLRDQLSADVLARYDRLNLKVTHATIPATTDANVTRPATTLGAGNFNTVLSVHLRDASGAQVEGVFKPLQPREGGWVARHTGIPRDDPQIAMRNIATASYAEKLGFNVIAQTKVALITTPPTRRGPGGTQLGLLMERGQGTLARRADASVMSKPQVLREVTKLQLLDHLTAQGDRHSSN